MFESQQIVSKLSEYGDGEYKSFDNVDGFFEFYHDDELYVKSDKQNIAYATSKNFNGSWFVRYVYYDLDANEQDVVSQTVEIEYDEALLQKKIADKAEKLRLL